MDKETIEGAYRELKLSYTALSVALREQSKAKQDLETTKSFMIKSNARAFETSRAKLNLLENISTLGWDSNYIKDREQIVKSMTIDQIKQLADKYLNPNKMYWLIVGDAETQLDRLKELGFGDPILINENTVEK